MAIALNSAFALQVYNFFAWLSKTTAQKQIRIDPYYQQQTCSLWTLVSDLLTKLCKVYVDIRGGSLERKRQATVESRVNPVLLWLAHWRSLRIFVVCVCVINQPVRRT